MQDVAIFWDYENCPAPSNASGCIIANNIRLMAQPFGRIKSLKAYLAITDQYTVARAVTLRSEFQASGVSLIDCPHNGRKEVADKMIIVDMLTYAIDNPAPSTIILITGDRDFAYPLSILRLRQYQVVLFTLPNAHSSLTAQASVCMEWFNVLNLAGQQGPRTTINPTIEDKTIVSKRDYEHELSVPCDPIQATQRAERPSQEGCSAITAHSRCSSCGLEAMKVELCSGRGRRQVPNDKIMDTDLKPHSPGVSSVQTERPPQLGEQASEPASIDKRSVHSKPSIPTKSPALNIDEPSPQMQVSSTLLPMEQPSILANWPSNREAAVLINDSYCNPPIVHPARPSSAPSTLPLPIRPGMSETDSFSSGTLLVTDEPSTEEPSPILQETTKPVVSLNTESKEAEFNAPPPTAVTPPSTIPIPSLNTFSSIVAITRSTPRVVRPIFNPLVEVLQAQRAKGQVHPQCRKIANNVAKNGITYKNAGVTKFGQYAELARKEGIVELGEKGGERWISLKPAWWSVKLT